MRWSPEPKAFVDDLFLHLCLFRFSLSVFRFFNIVFSVFPDVSPDVFPDVFPHEFTRIHCNSLVIHRYFMPKSIRAVRWAPDPIGSHPFGMCLVSLDKRFANNHNYIESMQCMANIVYVLTKTCCA